MTSMVPASQPEEPPASRTRDDIVQDIEALLVEMDTLAKPEDGELGWVLTDWMVIHLWQKPDGDEATTLDHRRETMSNWRIRGLIADILYDVDHAQPDVD